VIDSYLIGGPKGFAQATVFLRVSIRSLDVFQMKMLPLMESPSQNPKKDGTFHRDSNHPVFIQVCLPEIKE
jgi:hypothetical protein